MSKTVTSSESWDGYYEKTFNNKPFIIESFVARTFLSTRPISLLQDYDFNGKYILDMGCGDGRHISFFKQLGFNVVGTEISDKKISLLQKKFPECKILYSKSNSLKIKTAIFDYVAAINSIYYLESNSSKIEDNIKELSRVLKKGGIGLISFIGHEHFICDDKSIEIKSGVFLIKSNMHQCDEDTLIRVIKTKSEIYNIINVIGDLEVLKIGEIKDILDEKTRHLYYTIIKKNN